MTEFKSAFCSCRAPRPPYYLKDGERTCGACEKPRLPLPSDPVAILLTNIDPKTGKLSQEHTEECCGCALCELGD